jgi:hypothetical protein
VVKRFRTPIMLRPILRTALLAVIAGTAGVQPADADIYTWADASGSINVSNLSPPQGVRVISVAHASPESTAARENAAREAARRAETAALEERVLQLESEAALRRQAPTPVVYPVIAAPPPMQYWGEPAPVRYSVSMAPSAYTQSCDPGWMDCGLGLFPGFYPTSVVFLRTPSFRRFPATQVRHHFPVRQPMHSFGRFGRG